MSPNYSAALDAYCANERDRIADWKDGRVPRPSFTVDTLAQLLDAPGTGLLWLADMDGRELMGLRTGLLWIADVDPELRETCLARVRDIRSEIADVVS